ncbi:MAG: hypothetical protein RL338_1458 [Chloroflexota bacterium]
MSPVLLLLLALAISLTALYPVRRLAQAGWPPGRLALYWLGLVALGLLATELRGFSRPFLAAFLVAYVAPFVTLRAGIDRLLHRERPPVVRSGPVRQVGPGTGGATGEDGLAARGEVLASGDRADAEPPDRA